MLPQASLECLAVNMLMSLLGEQTFIPDNLLGGWDIL